MKYNSGSAFRQSLEERLRRQSMETGIPLLRLRKMAAFERFLARLLAAQPQTFLLLAEQAHLAWTLEQANDALARFLDPILQKRAAGSWRPDLWEWK